MSDTKTYEGYKANTGGLEMSHGKYPYISADAIESRMDDPDFFEYAIVFYDKDDEEWSVGAITSTRIDAEIALDALKASAYKDIYEEAHVIKISDAIWGVYSD